MPGIKGLYGRDWVYAADDLAFPAMMCGLGRVAWIALLAVVIWALNEAERECDDPALYWKHGSDQILIYASTGLVLYVVSIIVYMLILRTACTGTPVEVEKRSGINTLLKCLSGLVVFELAFVICGTWLSTREDLTPAVLDQCNPALLEPVWLIMHILAGFGWIEILGTACCWSIAWSFSTKSPVSTEDVYVPGTSNESVMRRKQRLQASSSRRCCCGPSRGGGYLWGNASVSPILTRSQDENGEYDDHDEEEEEDEDEDRYEEEDRYSFDSNEERAVDLLRSNATILSGGNIRSELNANFLSPFHSDGSVNEAYDPENYDESLGQTPKTWNRRCQRLFHVIYTLTCGMFGASSFGAGSPEAFRQVSTVLAGWFKNLELVPSDIVTALILMRSEQREQEKAAGMALAEARELEGRPVSNLNSRSLGTVGRWMWAGRGANSRARSRLHAQRVRASREAAMGHGGLLDDPEAVALLLHARDMAPFMLGMLGWRMYSYMHGVRGAAWLCCRPVLSSLKSACCCCCNGGSGSKPDARRGAGFSWSGWWRRERPDVLRETQDFLESPLNGSAAEPTRLVALGDTCCSFNTSALIGSAGRKGAALADVVYATFTSHFGQTVPYSVCVDHLKRRVVVAIRGSFTFEDAVTDLAMVPSPLKEHGLRWGFTDEIEPDSHAHDGLLRLASWMRHDLEKRDVLHRLLGVSRRRDAEAGGGRAEPEEEEARGRAFSVDALPDCHGYGLDVTGHSLGAGVAAVLSLFLRPAFPNIRCMAFSPPGCVFDYKLACKSAAWISCVFVGKDYAARMSWHALFKLRAQILDTLRRCRTNKFQAIMKTIVGVSSEKLLHKPDSVPDTVHTRAFQSRLDELLDARVRVRTVLDDVRLYMPGKIMHLVKDETIVGYCSVTLQEKYAPVWVDDRSALDEIVLSSRMVLDHMPDVVDRTLRHVLEDFVVNPNSEENGPVPPSSPMLRPPPPSGSSSSLNGPPQVIL